MSACDCCQYPIESNIYLDYKSVAASDYKGGFLDSGEYYMQKDINYPLPPPCGADEVCYPDYGSSFKSVDTTPLLENRIVKQVFDIDTRNITDTYAMSNSVGRYIWRHYTEPDCGGSVDSEITYQCSNYPVAGINTYSNPYTTEMVISRANAKLGSYPTDWNGSWNNSYAYRDLSNDGSSIYIQKMKFRVRHTPSATCYLKVWLRSKFIPKGGGTPTYTELTPYVWEGEGNPCLNDPTKSVLHENNEIKSTIETEIDVPSANGSVTVEYYKWSFLPDYTPSDDENQSDSGWPIP